MPTYPANYPIVNQLPADPHLPDNPDIQTLTRSLNSHGAYVHKIRHVLQNATAKLDKICMRQVPTPASLVGIGISRSYNQSNHLWENMSTGLIFATHTPCVIAHKRDFNSCILNSQAPYTPTDTTENSDKTLTPETVESLHKYSSALIKAGFTQNGGGPSTVSANAIATADKSREIEIRANLSRKHPRKAIHQRDCNSKNLVRILLHRHGRNLSEDWTVASLLDFLETHMRADPQIKQQIAHAIPKIRAMQSAPEQLKEWLRRANTHSKSSYSAQFRLAGSTLTPSECLILPRMQDIVGVCVEIGYPGSIDEGLYLQSLLPGTKPALVHCISDKMQSSLIAMDWTRDLLPLSKHGMQQFLLTGYILDTAGQRHKADFFSAMHQLALHGQIRFLKDRVGEDWCRFFPPGGVAPNPALDEYHVNIEELKRKFNNPNPFVQLMSACMPAAFQKRTDEEVTTALEQVLKNRESESVVRFFFHFCPPEKRPDADAVQRLKTRYPHHPAMPVLSCLVGMTPEQQEADRINLLTQEFHRLGSPQSMSFDLRSGWHETGKARFIPELMSFRVTEGVFHADYIRATYFEGLARYALQQEDMSLCVGVKKRKSDIVEAGFFEPDKKLIPRLTSGCSVLTSTDMPSLPDLPMSGLKWRFQTRGEQLANTQRQLAFAVVARDLLGHDAKVRPIKLFVEFPDENGSRQIRILDLKHIRHTGRRASLLEQLKGTTWQTDMGQSQLSKLIDTLTAALDDCALESAADSEQAHINRPDEAIKTILQPAKKFQAEWNASLLHAIQSNGGMVSDANSVFQRSIAQHMAEQFPQFHIRNENLHSNASGTQVE